MANPVAYLNLRQRREGYFQVEISLGRGVKPEVVGGSYYKQELLDMFSTTETVLKILGYTVKKELSGRELLESL